MQLPDSLDKRQREQHGLHKSRTYKVWAGMRARCKYPSATGYENYGGKGIKVCQRWESFLCFLADMGEAPPGMWIERGDGSRDYEPSNCRWATCKEQLRNRRGLRVLTRDGESLCASEWAERAGKPSKVIYARLNRGWSLAEAMDTPVRPHKQYERRAA